MKRIGVVGWALAATLLSASGCEPVDRPNRALPENFRATLLDGTVVTPTTLRGKAWVINLWVPG